MKHIVHTKNAPDPVGPYSQAVRAKGLVFLSGQIPLPPANGGPGAIGGSIEAQTRQVMENLKAVLTAAGSSFEQVLQSTIFLTDLENFGAVNKIYGEYFSEERAPARATVEVSRLPKDAQVEISMLALA